MMSGDEIASPADVGAWAIVTLTDQSAQAGRIMARDAVGVTLRVAVGGTNQTKEVFLPWLRVFCIERMTNRETIRRIVTLTANARVWLLPREQKYRFEELGWW